MRIRTAITAGIVCALAAPLSAQTNVVHGTLHTLTNTSTAPNGAWSWFEDERVIIDASNPSQTLLLASSVSSAANGDNESGDVDLLWLNLNTGQQGEFELADRFERDDHDSAALYMRPDGRYVAMYAKHTTEPFTRWRVSTNPHDPTSWGAPQSLSVTANTTYNNIHFLPNDNGGAGRTYNFTRANGFDPILQVSNDHGSTWSNAGQLLTEGDSGDRPYLKYASNGDKIHFISTEQHPRDFPNSIYHGYVKDGVLYDTNGTVRDSNLFNASAVSPTALTPVFKNGTQFNGTTMTTAWTIDLEIDNTGNPVGIFTTRANNNTADHRFFYARYDGATWQVNEMARAGGFLYAAENDYTGLASIDPNNPNVVYMSSDIDPRDGDDTSNYELYKGVTTDFGQTWTWSPITENSTMDNLRPVVPKWNGYNTAVAWMRGTYTSYTNWNTEIVAINLTDTAPKALLWKGNAASPTLWDVNTTSNWDSGGGPADVYREGDEVAFDDTAGSFNVHLTAARAPMGVAFNNSSHNYTITGAGISGSGRLRVFGGGRVTLANGANAFTGDTLIANGTLVLSNTATLSNTPHINVRGGGAFDVTAVVGGFYTLNNQTLTIDGDVVGNIVAANNSTVHVNSANSMNGHLTAQSGSLVTGAGRVVGNLAALSSSTIRVGGDGISITPSSVGLATYVDATAGASGNTARADGSVFTPKPEGTTGADNDWELRTLGNNGTSIEAGGEVAENAYEIKTTLTGLTPGSFYQVRAMFWDASSTTEDWNIRAGFTSNPGANTLYSPADATGDLGGATAAPLASSISYVSNPMFTDANRILYAATVGNKIADANGQIEVYIDDMPSAIGANRRTWYDGLAYSPIVIQGETLTVDGNVSLSATSILELDIISPSVVDSLDVTGSFTAGGTLSVSLVPGSPAPQLGDTFDILDFQFASGAFDDFDLPLLDPGLAWNTTGLLTTGSLQVIAAGDYNNDGSVDAADYVVWRKSGVVEQQYTAWQIHFGNNGGGGSSESSVPEPTAQSIMLAAVSTILLTSRRRQLQFAFALQVRDSSSF